MPAGRPLYYLPFFAVLCDEDIHSPASIVNNGQDCGLFWHYLSLTKKDEILLRRNMRHTFARFAHNHGFPTEGDGWQTHQPKGQQKYTGWRGHRWKEAARLISGKVEITPVCDMLRLERIGQTQNAPILLERDGLFLLEDVARTLKFPKKHIMIAAKALKKGDLNPWEHMGLVPMVNDCWLINMSMFAPFFIKCVEIRKKYPAHWSAMDFLRPLDIYHIAEIQKEAGLTVRRVRKMSAKRRTDLGIWTLTGIGGYVAQKTALIRKMQALSQEDVR